MRISLTLFLLLLTACGSSGGSSSDGSDGGGSTPTQPPAQADRRINTDPAGSELSLFPAMCCNGREIYVAWYDRRNGDLDVYFNRSLDGGATWLAQDIRLDSGLAGSAGSLLPRICCTGSNVYVVWYDERSGNPDIYFNRSLDRGLTWLPQDVRLDSGTAGAASSREPSICCDGARVYVAWHDDRGGSWDIYANRSLDGGLTWLPSDLRIDRDAGNFDARFVQLGCAGNNVVAAWSDERRGGSSVVFTRSLNGGLSWEATDTILDDADAAGIPRLVISGTRIHVVWTDVRSTMPHIRYNRSTNVGVDWLANDIQVDASTGGANNPQLCAFDLDFYVVWQDTRSGEADVYFQRTRDAGATWLASDTRLDRDQAGVATSWDPQVCCDNQNVHVAWRDDRAGKFDILMRWSGDRGTTWSSPELRLDTDPVGSAHSTGPALCCGGAFAAVVWMDDRNGTGSEADIYGNIGDFAPGG
ncbi:MAG: sialidase family protein [Planctomycetota bacterium]|nr:sialidase family protein [Planctomycetota bacterium]